ncbi:hypothetical protein WS62_04295 [Burkholderia sp. ABCPW 14]|uniref:hypothetical protein n=1 Tax=Burkholderia sp. ABCPW 14 TaxID=1637860 RepID=UPI000770CCEA|nr:hypothetical protein [Burkholderia sp. ABCPW 14]KVD74819.1 hypothetical protein WS62_04295 [Burkholderia sp. ABCPW 14]
MKTIGRILLALVLTWPIFIGVTSLPALSHWFGNGGEGWDTLSLVFRALGSAGGEQNEDIFVGILLLVSFAGALILSFILFGLIGRFQRSTNREA